MLLFILTAIIVYQLVGIVNRKNEIERLDNEITELTESIKDTETEILSWSEKWKIEKRARELGLHYKDED